MNIRFKNIGLFIILLAMCSACQDNDEMLVWDNACINGPLETIDDEQTCGDSDFFLICESIEVSDLISLEEEDFNWIPMLCNDIGVRISYKNEVNETFDITITDSDHFINKQRVNVGCDQSYEHASYICQRNETAYIEFSSPIFDDNLTKFELSRQINEVKDGTVGSPELRFTLEQPRANTNVYNFIFRVTVDEQYENRSIVFHDNLMLNDKEFTDVYEILVRETFHSEPHISVYINKGNGILGFKESEKFWLREN